MVCYLNAFPSLPSFSYDYKTPDKRGAEQSRVKKEKKSERGRKRKFAGDKGLKNRSRKKGVKTREREKDAEKMQSQEQRKPKDDMSTGKEGSN